MLKFLQGIEDLDENLQLFLATMVFVVFFAAIPLTYSVVHSFLPTCGEATQEKVEPINPTKKES